MGKSVAIPTENEARLSRLISAAEETTALIARLSDELNRAQRDLRTCLETDIPELMDELGYEKVDTEEYAISIKDIMTASVPEHKRQVVCAYLNKIGLDSLVTNEVNASFKPKEKEMFEKALKLLAGQKDLADHITTAMKVNTGSMKKAVKELLEQGADVDIELLGVNMIRQAVIKHK